MGTNFYPNDYISEEDKGTNILIKNNVDVHNEGKYFVNYSFDGLEKSLNVHVEKVTLALPEETVTIDYGSTFEPRDFIDSNFLNSDAITIDNQVKPFEVGNYKVRYTLYETPYELNVIVKDVSPILLKTSIALSNGSVFNPKDYLTLADRDNSDIKIENSVNTSVAGEYVVVYTLGNIEKKLNVSVKDKVAVIANKTPALGLISGGTTSPTTNTQTPKTETPKTETPKTEKPKTEAPKKKAVQITSITSSVNPGQNANIKIKGTPNTDYTITVYYNSGASEAAGLNSKKSDSEGNVEWTWKVGTRTAAGKYKIAINSSVDSYIAYFTVN